MVGVAAVLALAVGTILRRSAPAITAVQQSLPKWPQIATVYQPPDYYPLAPWAGFAVLCGYAVLAMGLALFLLRRRDA
jgi:uncharacterized membrane protein